MFKFENVIFKNIINIKNFNIDEKIVTTLVGESGCGKTTILRMLNKLISPSSGEIFFKKQPISQIDSIFVRRQITMVSQSSIMLGNTVRENLHKGFVLQKRDLPTDLELEKILEKVRLDKALDDSVHHLSGGEKQRLAIGRALALKSDVYLLDEPSSALDSGLADDIVNAFISATKPEGKTIVMVTHSKDIAKKYSDKIARVANGGISYE